jgi:hypothetical protein
LSSHIWTRSKVKWMTRPASCEWHNMTPAVGPPPPSPPGPVVA